MSNKVVITKTKDCNWLSNEKYGELKWKLLIDSTTKMTSDISVGLVKIKPNNSLALHHHSPKELYIIKKERDFYLNQTKMRF